MKLFSYTTRASIPALCLALLTLFVWQQPSGWFKATSNSSSASPSAGASAGGGTQRLASAEQVPDGLQHSDWNSIRSAYEKQRHAVVAVEGGQRAHNPGQQWRTRFDGRGFAVTPDQGDWTWGLELDSYGFAAAPRAVGGQARVTTEGPRVAYQWDETLEEWYVNDRRGLEHGFTLKARPTPADASGNGPLELRLRVRGELRAQVTADGQSISFVQPDGGAVVNYSGLKVWDADGQAVAARFAPEDGAGDRLRLTVEESGAQYPLTIDPIAQQAYLKASNTGASDRFGQSVAVSGDTVVVGAIFEDSNATGVNGDGTNNGADASGAAYVFVRSGTTWTQQAYLKASNSGASDQFGYSVAVSGDTVVVGAPVEASNATGVNGDGTNNDADASGAAYVFVRSGTTWSQQAYLKASNSEARDQFGWSVAVAGDTVVVGALVEDSNATGVNGNQENNSAIGSGAAYVFVRGGTTWSQQAYLKASNSGERDYFGYSVAVAGDTVVVGAYQEDSNATGVNGNSADNSTEDAGAAYVFVRNGTTWSQQAYLKASNTGASDQFGYSVAVAGDTVVVGARDEDSDATGVNSDGTNDLAENSGAAYVFVRNGTMWSWQAYLKASNTEASDHFGESVAVAGDTVVVGAYQEASNATGVNGDGTNNSAIFSGAAYVFVRGGTTWSQQAYLKASNTGVGDFFGISVAVAGDTVVVGATGESSNATGVNGNGTNNSASSSGAAYVFAPNSLPTITSNNVPVQAGSSAASFTIATAADADQAVNTLGITINGNPTTASSNGVTVSNVAIQANGSVTANISTTCGATTATFNLVVTDNQTATGNGRLTVTVTPNLPPMLSYSATTVVAGTVPAISPATGPSDIGTFTIGSVSVSPNNGSLGVLLNQTNGTVTILSATLIGNYTVTVPISDNCSATHNAQLNITVVCPTITLNPASLPNATVNTAYPQTISASPAGGNYSFTVTGGSLPAGLTLNSNGSFSGAPTQSGTFNFRITATGFGSCSAFQDYVLNVGCTPITVSPTSLPGGSIGATYNQSVSAAPAGAYNYAVTSGALPTGLTLNAATGAITGTPTVGGSFNFTVTASQGACNGSQSYTVTIGCAAITLSQSSPLPTGQVGTAYSQAISASPAGSYSYSITLGSLPSGLTLNTATGLLSGTPNLTGNFTFTITALATGGCTASQSYALAVTCPTVTLAPNTLPDASTGATYSQTLSATPVGGTYTYAVTTGSLPTGLNLNASTGVISGTPTVANTFNFRVTATGFGGCTGFRDYTIVIGGGGCPTITLPATLPNGTVGGLYSNSAAASPAGTYSYTVSSGTLPPGMTLYGSFGLLFGFPGAAGSYTFTITATQGACTGSQTYTVLISAGFASSLTVASDFDGDLKSDVSVFSADGKWAVAASGNGQTQATAWGAPYAPYYDLSVSGDYDGDGKTDLAVFRRGTEGAGHWFIKRSSDDKTQITFWGLPTDVPVPGDYDGDGKTDIAVWRASVGVWFIIRSSDGTTTLTYWGTSSLNDTPVPGDYDGDGKTDAAVFRRSGAQAGHWLIKRSSDDKPLDVKWGLPTDMPVQGDYDGDNKTDYAVWRASEGVWYWVESGTAALRTVTLGVANDIPVPADYDGDGKADAGIWQAATGSWQIQRSSDNKLMTRIHGQNGDTPVPARKN